MNEHFGELLESFRLRAGRSRNSLAKECHVDASYVTRLSHGDRDPPRVGIVDAIARALKLSIADRNRLLVSAGYAPLSVVQLGSWADSLQAVADVLTDIHLSLEERAAFEQIVISIAQRWRGNAIPRVTNGVELMA